MPSNSSNARWLHQHIGSDRALLRLVLPFDLVQEATRSAAEHGVSLTAYVSAALSLLREKPEQLALRVRLLEREHGVRFRRAKKPHSVSVGAPSLDGDDRL